MRKAQYNDVISMPNLDRILCSSPDELIVIPKDLEVSSSMINSERASIAQRVKIPDEIP